MFKRIVMAALAIPVFLFISYFFTTLYPDFLWFDSFGFKSLWLFVVKAKVLTFCVFSGLSLVWLGFHAFMALRISDRHNQSVPIEFNTPIRPLNDFLRQLKDGLSNQEKRPQSARFYNNLIKAVVVGLSVMFGLSSLGWWDDFFAFFHQHAYGLLDPILQKDVSFYLFNLPVLEHIQGWLFSLVFVAFCMVAWVYFSKNILLVVFSKQHRTSFIRRHVLMLVGFLFLVLAFSSVLDIFALLFSERGVVFGTGYTDHHISLMLNKWIALVYLVEAILIFIWAFRPGFKLPLYGFIVLILSYFLGGGVIEGVVQSYFVSPNELVKERSYIEHNIKFTREAYNLEAIQSHEFEADTTLTEAKISANSATIQNIRLWNQEPLKQTFSQLQEIRLYYEFENIDVDRYMIDGQLQQVMLSPRELDSSQLTSQAQTWTNSRLVYTHGYGLCMSPVTKITKEGLPHFYIKDIPPVSSIDRNVTRPEIYFGEKTKDWVVVNTKQKEFDYPKGDMNVYTHYNGKGGVQLNSLIKRLVYAFKFSDLKLLVTNLIKDDSRMLYDRDIRTIVKKLTPFIAFDSDPYIVVSEAGRMVWMLDGYTYSNRFPYSEPYGAINYIRNSVKVTIDAYSGDVHYYVINDKDPLIKTYASFYPGVFSPFSEMPEDLKQHVRYPKDLFTIQAEKYNTYHMTDYQVFYNREDLWEFPKETYGETEQTMKAYYMVTKLPEEASESFVLMLPFTPTNKHNMIAWMSVKCDLENYGQMQVYKFPKERTIYGPMQIESRIDQNTDISQSLTLWGQMGSRVIRGNLMVVPIENSLIYVEPIYLQATQSKFPELKRVIFSYADSIVMTETLDSSIRTIFSDYSYQSPQSKVVQKPQLQSSPTSLLRQLKDSFGRVKQSASSLNWVGFGQELKTLETVIDQIQLEK